MDLKRPRFLNALLTATIFLICISFGGVRADDRPNHKNRRAIGANTRITRFHQSGVNAHALQVALGYMQRNSDVFASKTYFAVVDYTLPSTAKRLYIFNRRNGSWRTYWVAHGRNSGLLYSRNFSDKVNSLESSLGFFRTGDIYDGEHGPSLRLIGLTPGFNDLAYIRDIVVHGADYVSEDFIKTNGRLGRSLGCLAVDLQARDEVISVLKDGALIYAYGG